MKMQRGAPASFLCLISVLSAACSPNSGSTTGNLATVGEACAAINGAEQCGVAASVSARLECKSGTWVLLETCPAPSYCTVSGAVTTVCATGGTSDVAGADGAADTDVSQSASATVVGGFTATIDGKPVTIDYKGAKVEAVVHHSRTASLPIACVPRVTVQITPDGQEVGDRSCGLDLEFRADFHGKLRLETAKFYATAVIEQGGVVLKSFPCKLWPEEAKSGEVAYVNADAGTSALAFEPLSQPAAAQSEAVLSGVTLNPQGKVELSHGAHKFTLDLDPFKIVGSVDNIGTPGLACAKAHQPLPDLVLEDINPGSPYFGESYSLNKFKGKYVVVLMAAGWDGPSLSQAHYLEKIKGDLEAKGRNDFVMAAINDASAATEPSQKALYTCSKSPCPTVGASLSFPVMQGTKEAGWSAFEEPGHKIKGHKNDCFIFAPDGRFIFRHYGKGTVYLGQFDTEVRTALDTKLPPLP